MRKSCPHAAKPARAKPWASMIRAFKATNTPRWVMPVAPLDLVLRGAQHGILTR